MCGITGIWRFDSERTSPEELTAFNDAIGHRGPDAKGIWIDEKSNLGLGHRRLSILDLSEKANQPMFSSDGNFVLVFNGEIFNFIELREELRSVGYTFKTDSDAEVLIYSYIYWGRECLNKFNGMWAFALYDVQKEELFISRDRYGIKPLYFTYKSNKLFAFSSETLGFSNVNGFSKTLNEKHLNANHKDPYILEGKGLSIYRGIRMLKPGHCLTITKNDFKNERWYQIPKKVNSNISFKDAAEEYRAIFKDACKIRLRSDVNIAQTLSGGLDSSCVFAMNHQLFSENVPYERSASSFMDVFHMSFENKDNDEREYAFEMANSLNYKINELKISSSENASFILNSTLHMDCLSHTPQIQLMHLYKSLNENGFKVSMDGHGVDEQMYGYREMVEDCLNYAIEAKDIEGVSNFSKVYYQMYHPTEHMERGKFWKNEVEVLQSQVNRKSYKLKKTLGFGKRISQSYYERSILGDFYSVEDDVFGGLGYYDQVVSNHFFQSTLSSLLRNFDKTSMRYGVELRTPFMDYRLVEFLYSLPYQYKIGNGFTKRILRESMQNQLPKSISERTFKIGLTTPLEHLVSKDMVKIYTDYFNSKDLVDNKVYNIQKTKGFLKNLQNGNAIADMDKLNLWKHFNAQILYKESK